MAPLLALQVAHHTQPLIVRLNPLSHILYLQLTVLIPVKNRRHQCFGPCIRIIRNRLIADFGVGKQPLNSPAHFITASSRLVRLSTAMMNCTAIFNGTLQKSVLRVSGRSRGTEWASSQFSRKCLSTRTQYKHNQLLHLLPRINHSPSISLELLQDKTTHQAKCTVTRQDPILISFSTPLRHITQLATTSPRFRGLVSYAHWISDEMSALEIRCVTRKCAPCFIRGGDDFALHA